jgi:hypothetical protein
VATDIRTAAQCALDLVSNLNGVNFRAFIRRCEQVEALLREALAAEPPSAPAKPKLGPNHNPGCNGSGSWLSGSGYNRVRVCPCGAEDHEPDPSAIGDLVRLAREMAWPSAPAQGSPDTEKLARAAWLKGFGLCLGYGDNHHHFHGEQQERLWAKAWAALREEFKL